MDRIAYVFDADYQDGLDEALAADGVVALVEEWIAGSGQGGLWETESEDGSLWLIDERPWITDARSVRLVGWKAEVYRRCDGIAAEAELVEVAAAAGITVERLQQFLHWCLARHYLASDGQRYLGVAVHHPPRWPAKPSPTRRPIPVSTS